MTFVYCATRNLYPQLPTTINSLLQNNPYLNKIYLLIEDDDIEYINHPKIEFINCNQFDFLIRTGINISERFTYMSMVRCFLTKILNEDKVIYLDVDTIIDDSLFDLWIYPLEGCLIGGCEEVFINQINSGVMVMDLKGIKNKHLDDEMINILKTKKLDLPDQDAINETFKYDLKILPQRFNCFSSFALDYAIRHFIGVIKPWNENAKEEDKQIWNKYKTERVDYNAESQY